MNKKNIILIIIILILIVVPIFINTYSIYKLISLGLGIILLNINFALGKKANIFLLVCLPIILIIFTYSLDYLKVFFLNLSPIYVFENKVNDKVSVYSSLFYRIFKCDDNYLFDNQYKNKFLCDTELLVGMDINNLLNEPEVSFQKYKNDFIKITGKISKIIGTNSILLQTYKEFDSSLNGYVKFNENSKLKVLLQGIDISKYRIYDQITVVGLLSNFDEENQELKLIDVKLEENDLYKNFSLQVIESSICNKELKEYTDNFYMYCLENIYLDYGISKYELSYALKDKKITFDELVDNEKLEIVEGINLYRLEKFNIISCKGKNILANKKEELDYSWCKE